jgi:hypothetical protein
MMSTTPTVIESPFNIKTPVPTRVARTERALDLNPTRAGVFTTGGVVDLIVFQEFFNF